MKGAVVGALVVAAAVVLAVVLYWMLYVRNAPSPRPPTPPPPPPPPLPPPNNGGSPPTPTPPTVGPTPPSGIFPPPGNTTDPTTARTGRWVRIDRAAAGHLNVASIAALRPGKTPAKIPVTATAMTMPPYDPTTGPERVADDDPKTFALTKNPLATNTFVEIDLGADTTVGTIVVGNRTDCCGDRLLGATVSLLNAARQTVWARPVGSIGSVYTFPMAGPAVRTPPALAFTLDASAAGALFADADGRTPAVDQGTVRHWRATDGSRQTLTFNGNAVRKTNPFGGSRSLVYVQGAEGVYALPTVEAAVDERYNGGATLVVVCVLPTETIQNGHPWSVAAVGEPRLPAINGALHETFYSSGRTAWVPAKAEVTNGLFVYAVVADPITGITTTFLNNTSKRVRSGFRWNGAEPARMSAWTAGLAELRVYRGALGVNELNAVITELKAKWK